MIEQTASTVESVVRAATAVFVLAINAYVVWHFYGAEIRRWWQQTVLAWWNRQWIDHWNAKWQIDAHGTAQDG